MPKAKSGKVIQMLSPENYIRRKARSLPIYECLINSNWEVSKIVNAAVARRHTNGNITACFYLVDLMCLGVKDTDYMFNQPLFEYKETVERLDNEFTAVNYELVHNIIYSALEFAGEYGFSPHKDFSSITSFMLEEDDDKIEIIDIECGYDGKPAYMHSPYESDQEADKIIRRLEKTAGSGNFMVFDYYNEDDPDDFDDDDFENEENEFDGISYEEKRAVFFELSERFESLTPEEIGRFSELTTSVFKDLSDEAEIDRYYNEFSKDLNYNILPEADVPDELLGITADSLVNHVEIKELFIDIYDSIGRNHKNDWKKWNNFRKIAKDIPVVFFLELLLLRSEDSKKYDLKFKKYKSDYKHYHLLRLLWLADLVSSEDLASDDPSIRIKPQSFFNHRKSIHRIELYFYLMYLLYSMASENNPSGILALNRLSGILDSLSDSDLIVFINTTSIIKMKIVIDHFTK